MKNEAIKSHAVEFDYGFKSTFLQVILCIVGNSALLSSGMTLGFTAVALPYMLAPNDVIHIDTDQASWIASLATIVTPIGCLVSGPIIDRLGRKAGLLILNVPAFIGWLCIAINPALTQLYIGRLLTGFACGLSSIPATVYSAESSTASIRGLLVTGTSISISMGVAIVYILGLFLQENWQLVAGICAIFPVLSVVLIYTLMPESPVWLITKQRQEEAGKALKILRGTKAIGDIQHELDELTERINTSRKGNTSFASTLSAMARPEAYKPLILMNIFFLFQQLTGIFVVIFYAVDVVREAGVTTDPYVVAVLIGLTRLVVTVFAAWMSKRFGRRPTAIISGIGMAVSLIALASHLYVQLPTKLQPTIGPNATEVDLLGNFSPMDIPANLSLIENLPKDMPQNMSLVKELPQDQPNNLSITENLNGHISNLSLIVNPPTEPPTPSLLPVIAILLYILASTIGFLTLPWSMIGEVYPAQVRGVASGLTTCITYLVSFVAVKLYPTMIETMDKHGVFFFYGSMAVLGTIFVFFFLPETQGKTLAEIEQYFASKKNPKATTDEEQALHNIKMGTITSGMNKPK